MRLESLSPAAIRYLRRRGYDHKTLIVAIVSLIMRGVITVSRENGVVTLTCGRWVNPKSTEQNSIEERLIQRELSACHPSLPLKGRSARVLSALAERVKDSMDEAYGDGDILYPQLAVGWYRHSSLNKPGMPGDMEHTVDRVCPRSGWDCPGAA